VDNPDRYNQAGQTGKARSSMITAVERRVDTARTLRVRRSWRHLRRNVVPYVFLAPFLISFLAFVAYPLIYAANLSIYRTRIIGGTTFVGLDNYLKALSDDSFWTGVRNMVAFGIIQVPVMLGAALGAALLLDGGILKRPAIFRLIFFLPFAVPSVVAALVWGYLYGQSFGPIAQFARFLGVDPPLFIGPATVIPALANITTWQWTGYNMVIMYAALKSIPTELYEAARVDGASGLRIAWHIKIPFIAPAIMLTLVFSIIGTFQLFNEPNLLRISSPTIIGTNFTPNMYVYNLAFGNQQFDYSAAIAFTLAAVTGVLVGVAMGLNAWHRRRA
jgi:multiple sugar transport system permease protein